MKLACSSTAFDVFLRSGELTQLEWIDLCAYELAVDGVVFDVRHFPRTDTDYLAQVKKMAVDSGLDVAAICGCGFFEGEPARMRPDACAGPGDRRSFGQRSAFAARRLRRGAEMLGKLGAATSLAKKHNVTHRSSKRAGDFCGIGRTT